MQDNSNFTENMDTLFNDLQNYVKTDTSLGTPLTVGDKTLVPVMSVALGYGGTDMGTKQKTTNTTGSSTGIGLGAKVSTSAVLVIDSNSTTMLPVNTSNNAQQMMSQIPQALSNLGQKFMGQGMSGGQGQQNSQGGQQNQQQGSMQNSQQNQQQNSSNTPMQSTMQNQQQNTQQNKQKNKSQNKQ